LPFPLCHHFPTLQGNRLSFLLLKGNIPLSTPRDCLLTSFLPPHPVLQRKIPPFFDRVGLKFPPFPSLLPHHLITCFLFPPNPEPSPSAPVRNDLFFFSLHLSSLTPNFFSFLYSQKPPFKTQQAPPPLPHLFLSTGSRFLLPFRKNINFARNCSDPPPRSLQAMLEPFGTPCTRIFRRLWKQSNPLIPSFPPFPAYDNAYLPRTSLLDGLHPRPEGPSRRTRCLHSAGLTRTFPFFFNPPPFSRSPSVPMSALPFHPPLSPKPAPLSTPLSGPVLSN